MLVTGYALGQPYSDFVPRLILMSVVLWKWCTACSAQHASTPSQTPVNAVNVTTDGYAPCLSSRLPCLGPFCGYPNYEGPFLPAAHHRILPFYSRPSS